MKHTKSRGGGGTGAGLSGILKNQEAYQRWTRTMSEHTKYYQATLSLADMTTEICDGSSHKDLRKAEIAKSEKQVIKTIDAIKSFIDPFDVEDHQKLYYLSSGVAVDRETVQDVLRAEKVGKEMKETFIKDRLEKKEMYFEPRTKSGKLLTSSNKVVQCKQEGNAAFGLFVRLYNHLETRLDLLELMSYHLTPIPYRIATADGFFAKTNKAKCMELIAKDVDDEPFPQTMKLWSLKMEMQYFTVCLECQGIAEKIFNPMAKKHS